MGRLSPHRQRLFQHEHGGEVGHPAPTVVRPRMAGDMHNTVMLR
jgi:hypothetical protein